MPPCHLAALLACSVELLVDPDLPPVHLRILVPTSDEAALSVIDRAALMGRQFLNPHSVDGLE